MTDNDRLNDRLLGRVATVQTIIVCLQASSYVRHVYLAALPRMHTNRPTGCMQYATYKPPLSVLMSCSQL